MVEADDDEITIDLQDTNYYTSIQEDENSNNNYENQEINENIGLHNEAKGSDEDIRPDEAQSSNANDNLISSVETISNDTHLMSENETTKPQEAVNDDPTPAVTKSA